MSLLTSILIQVAVLVLYSSNLVFAGPYSIIFSLFVLYYDLPAFWTGTMLGFPASDKVFIYFLGFQVTTTEMLTGNFVANALPRHIFFCSCDVWNCSRNSCSIGLCWPRRQVLSSISSQFCVQLHSSIFGSSISAQYSRTWCWSNQFTTKNYK